MITIKETDILAWLDEVKDPEIPVLSLVDLGIITSLQVSDNNAVIEITPTFVGCPALEMMKAEIVEKLREKGVGEIQVIVTFREPWSSDKISEKGKQALKAFGLAPPPNTSLFQDLDVLEHAICPRCSGENTDMKSAFGATLCRSMHYCNDCREAFEQFKPI